MGGLEEMDAPEDKHVYISDIGVFFELVTSSRIALVRRGMLKIEVPDEGEIRVDPILILELWATFCSGVQQVINDAERV
jgi:hypothetical protein